MYACVLFGLLLSVSTSTPNGNNGIQREQVSDQNARLNKQRQSYNLYSVKNDYVKPITNELISTDKQAISVKVGKFIRSSSGPVQISTFVTHTPVSSMQPTSISVNTSSVDRRCKRHLPYFSEAPIQKTESINRLLPATIRMLNFFSGSKDNELKEGYILKQLCRTSQTHLLFVVFSTPNHTKHRNNIRHTWASLEKFNFDGLLNRAQNGPRKVDYFFLITFPEDIDVTLQELDLISEEVHRELDVLPIQLKSVQRTLVNLHLLVSEYLLTTCQQKIEHVVFIDEDLMPNIPLLGSFLNAQKIQDSDHPIAPIYCFSVVNAQPKRPKKNKPVDPTEVSHSEWTKPSYPTHCDLELGGFAISMKSLELLYLCSRWYRTFKLPNVYLTGILPEAAGIPVQSYWTTHGQTVQLMPSFISESQAGQHLFFSNSQQQPKWVWQSVFRATISTALR
ncbi:Hexosyltransferase [Paragonimus heterotremus]|uniref:Hexosyltransferase n=1 Tax=Paragonimus heterotremus TaxID=100268 RepID=A0A8J4SSI7_9TREM|nr:Hexosyltransferase [Paragonimus heterotremus]